MSRHEDFNRREIILGATVTGVLAGATAGAAAVTNVVENRRIKQSVCKWCYRNIELDALCAGAASIGLYSVELLGPESFDVVKKHGLICALVNSHGITRGLNNPEHQPDCLDKIERAVEAASEAGFPNVITFSSQWGRIRKHLRTRYARRHRRLSSHSRMGGGASVDAHRIKMALVHPLDSGLRREGGRRHHPSSFGRDIRGRSLGYRDTPRHSLSSQITGWFLTSSVDTILPFMLRSRR